MCKSYFTKHLLNTSCKLLIHFISLKIPSKSVNKILVGGSEVKWFAQSHSPNKSDFNPCLGDTNP